MGILKKIIIFMVVTFKLFIYIINQSIWNSSLVAYLYLIVIFLLSIPFILKLSFNKSSFIKTFVILFISFIMFALYREDNIFLYSILALLTMENDDKEVVKTFFYSAIIICIVTILLGSIGVIPMNDSYRTIDGKVDIRMSLGFPNANALFSYVLPIVLSGIYLYDKKPAFNIIALVTTTILFYFCKSRTGYYLTLLVIILNLFPFKKIISRISKKSFLYFFIISILLAVLFGSTKYNEINTLLSGRPWYYLKFLKMGPLVWGCGIPNNLILDNLYLRLLANYHIVGFGLYYYIFYRGAKLCDSDQKLLFSSFFLLLYGILESVTVVNFVIVIFLKYIFKSYKESV